MHGLSPLALVLLMLLCNSETEMQFHDQLAQSAGVQSEGLLSHDVTARPIKTLIPQITVYIGMVRF
uniref:Uncharacterized protein n=1 Tax=Anguilla anguilla TaxID=7936 RepID=A0A0E9XPL0_ANGAN